MASLPDPGSIPVLDSIAPRPPTPPRESCREPPPALKPAPGRLDPSDSCPSPLQTPPTANTPTSNRAPDSSLNSRRKRVEWSAHTEYKEYFDVRRLDGRLAKSFPISAASPRPIKGILKPSQSHNLGPGPSSLGSTSSDDPTGQLNIIDMLDSTIKQLAGSDRHSKIDAYMMLSRALKASNNLPDRVALQTKMSLFMHFIQRDVTFKNPNGTIDASLTNHALTLLATFLHFPAIASTLSTEFCVWTLDFATRAFEHPATPKDILRHLMQIVAAQSFSSKVMTSARVGRLIKALHHIENHVTGKSIVMSRIRIYRRLVKQSKGFMAQHLDWVEDVFVDMLSGSAEIRAEAIKLAAEAGFALRSEAKVPRKVNDIFQTTNNEDSIYIDFFIKRLNEMLAEKQLSASVPQIWAAVILFLPYPLDRWRHYSPWLKVVQSGFNADDGLTKQEANHAWNRHIYLTLHDTGKMSSKALATLCLPLLTQLRKKATPKNVEAATRLRRTVVGGICTIFYYLLAPGDGLHPNEHPNDFVWDNAVQPFIAELISLDGKPDIPAGCLMQAAHLLSNLLDVTTPRAWQPDRIHRNPPVTPDELPSLDAKWIRRNCDKVMQAVSPIIESHFIDLANKDSTVFRLWHALAGSIDVASAKDIKVSEDTVKFFACTFGLLSRVWSAGVAAVDGLLSAAFLPSVRNFIGVLTNTLGLLPFTEKRLSTSGAHTFWPSSTPSTPSRTDNSAAIDRPILHHLFLLLSSGPSGASDDSALTDFFLSAIDPFLSGKTEAARIDLVSELLSILPPDDRPSSSGPWVFAARQYHTLIESYHDGGALGSANNGKILGPSLREIVFLLERGLTRYPNLPADQWFSLFNRLSEHVADKFGEAGRCIIIVEPLAKVLVGLFDSQTEKMSSTGLSISRTLFDIAKFPRDRASLEIARHRLWGTPMNTARGSVFDPFEHLYKLGNHVLELFHKEFRRYDPGQDVSPFIQALGNFIIRSFPLSRARTLSRLQPGLCYWIRDSKALLGDSLLSNTVLSAWHDVCSALVSRRPLDRSEFDSVEPILGAAFESKNMGIVKRALDTWTLLVSGEGPLDCSDGLKTLAISSSSRLETRNTSEQSSGGLGAQACSLPRRPSNASLVLLSSASSSQNAQSLLSPSASDSTSASNKRSRKKRRAEATPDGSRAKSARKEVTPRARQEQPQCTPALPPFSPSPRLPDEAQSLTERQQKVIGEKRRDKAGPSLKRLETLPVRPIEESSKTNEAIAPAGNPTARPASSAGDLTFSSRAETPSTVHQHAIPMIKPSSVPPASASNASPGKAKKTGPSQPPPATNRSQATIPPPVLVAGGPGPQDEEGEQERRDTEMTDADAPLSRVQNARLATSTGNPQTPQRQRTGAISSGEENLRFVDEQIVDGEGSADGGQSVPPDAGVESADSSFSLSELDDSSVMKLIVELQAHEGADEGTGRSEGGTGPRTGREEGSGAKGADAREEEEGLLLPTRPQRSAESSERASSPSLPPLVAEPIETSRKNRPGQKRKRPECAQHSNQGKKRRTDLEEIPETPGMQASAAQAAASPERNLRRSNRRQALPSVSSIQTRGSTRRRPRAGSDQGHAEDAVVEAARTRAERQGKTQQEGQQDDKPDTDDEVLSQLMSESIASSHDMSHIEQELRGGRGRQNKDAVKAPDTTTHETRPSQDGNSGIENQEDAETSVRHGADARFRSLLQGLQSGLGELRAASLSRDEFNEMEDVLMDMKRELFAAEERGRGRRGRNE